MLLSLLWFCVLRVKTLFESVKWTLEFWLVGRKNREITYFYDWIEGLQDHQGLSYHPVSHLEHHHRL